MVRGTMGGRRYEWRKLRGMVVATCNRPAVKSGRGKKAATVANHCVVSLCSGKTVRHLKGKGCRTLANIEAVVIHTRRSS